MRDFREEEFTIADLVKTPMNEAGEITPLQVAALKLLNDSQGHINRKSVREHERQLLFSLQNNKLVHLQLKRKRKRELYPMLKLRQIKKQPAEGYWQITQRGRAILAMAEGRREHAAVCV